MDDKTVIVLGIIESILDLDLLEHREYSIKCPECNNFVPTEEMDYHIINCLTKSHLIYLDYVLAESKGSCSICLEDFKAGDVVARLPCLSIYHKSCIDSWFKVKPTCPEHPVYT